MTTLCLDFGNSRLKYAVYQDDVLTKSSVLPAHVYPAIKNIIETDKPQHSILSSVIDHDVEIENLLAEHTTFHKLSSGSKLPFTIPVGKPETVGADRLAIAAAAVHLYPHQNNLVIVLGSCITYNFINAQSELIGGSISPGVTMRFKAMHHFTAKLPLVAGDWNVPLIGYDTKTNLQSGVVLGTAKELDGIVDLYQEKFSNFNVLLTGGDMGMIRPHLKNKIFADPDLIFKGLYAISQINNA